MRGARTVVMGWQAKSLEDACQTSGVIAVSVSHHGNG